jgi:hypothetical protein
VLFIEDILELKNDDENDNYKSKSIFHLFTYKIFTEKLGTFITRYGSIYMSQLYYVNYLFYLFFCFRINKVFLEQLVISKQILEMQMQ